VVLLNQHYQNAPTRYDFSSNKKKDSLKLLIILPGAKRTQTCRPTLIP